MIASILFLVNESVLMNNSLANIFLVNLANFASRDVGLQTIKKFYNNTGHVTLSFEYWTPVVYFDQRMHACACVCMVENDQKHKKMMKKVHFSSCIREAHVRLTKKKEKKVCWSAIGSDSQKLVDT